MARLVNSWFDRPFSGGRIARVPRSRLRRTTSPSFDRPAVVLEVLEDRTLLTVQPLMTLQLKPLDLNLLGLHVTSDPITVTVSSSSGDGKLLGNLLGSASSLVNLDNVSTALNQVLGTTVDLLNSVDLNVTGVGSGVFSTHTAGTTEVLDLYVAPVKADLLGVVVTTSPVHLNVTAEAGNGLVLGNVLTDLADLFNPPLPDEIDVETINTKLTQLLTNLNSQIPGIPAASSPTRDFAPGDVLSLTVPPIDLDLLGLNLQTSQITVDAHAATGDGLLLGNILTSVLNTLDATPEQLHDLSANLNGLLAKVVGVLNASTLTLPAGATDTLSDTLKSLALPDLVTAAPGASTPVLDLVVHSSDGKSPPVKVDLLGLTVTTSDIDALLSAKTGNGQILGNLVYNVANLLNPGGTAGLFGLINDLVNNTSSGTAGTGLDPTAGSTGPVSQVLELNLPPIDLDLLGLEVASGTITLTVSAQAGDGKLLGNAVGGLATLLDTQAVSTAVNNVLGSVVNLVNSASAQVSGVLNGAFTGVPAGSTTSASGGVTDVLNLVVAPVHLDLLGVIVDTGPITLTVRARAGAGLVLGNVLTALTDLFNPPLPDTLDLDFINSRLQQLLQDLKVQLPGVTPATVPAPVITDNRIVSLTLPALDLNLLGLKLATQPITVNADALTGDGLLLGNVLQTVLNTLGATPTQLSQLSANLNGLLAEVFGLLNSTTLTLPVSALNKLSGPLATLALPNLVTATPGAAATVLDLSIASTDGTTPPVNLDLLGLKVTTSEIKALLSAQTGDGQVLGNLLYNIANLLNSGSPAALLGLLGQLGSATAVPNVADQLIGFFKGGWYVGTSNGIGFSTATWAQWNANAAWDALLRADVNGDGRPDVAGLLDGEWWVGVSNGTAFTTTRWAKWSNVDWRNVVAADLNGDGKADLLARVGGQWWAALSNGTGLAAPKLWASWADAAWDKFFLTDVTGDAKADLLGYIDGEWWSAASAGTAFGTASRWAKWRDVAWDALGTGDFDGDGKQDVYGLIDGAWYVGKSGVSSFGTSLRATWSAAAEWLDAVVGDFDGDGRDDLAARSLGQWWVSRSDASGGQAGASLWGVWSDLDWQDVRVGDFDGDGQSDIAGLLDGAWYVARSNGVGFLTSLWSNWSNLTWQIVSATDSAGSAVRTASGGGSEYAVPTFAPASVRNDAAALYWSHADEDEELLVGA